MEDNGRNNCLNYKRRIRKQSLWLRRILNYCILLSFCHLISVDVDAVHIFREANERTRQELKNDRPCNFMLDIKDAHLLTPGIIEKYGYPAERHWVTTEDGYILELHRIPARKKDAEYGYYGEIKPAPVVFLMHGVIASSRDFVINCERRALAFKLWDSGYDVWLGNYRGNTYSRNHTRLTVKDGEFWNFSVDEVGYYDLPAMIDYVLHTTKLKSLSFVAHSLGNGVMVAMLTMRPEYNAKIDMWFGLSAAVTLQGTLSPFVRILVAFPRTILHVLTRYNHGEFFPEKVLKFLNRLAPYACKKEGKTENFHGLCSSGYFLNDGYDPGQIPPKFLSVIGGQFPASTSAKIVVQWLQWILSGQLAMFDEGPFKNIKKYGTYMPTPYELRKLNTPLFIFYGANDMIVAPSDVRKSEKIFMKLFPNGEKPYEFYEVETPRWNHGDFIYGKDADIYVYDYILRMLEEVYSDKGTKATKTKAYHAKGKKIHNDVLIHNGDFPYYAQLFSMTVSI